MHVAYVFGLKPAFGPESFNVGAENLFLTVEDPGIGADDGAGGEVVGADREASAGNDSGEGHADGGVKSMR